MKDSCQMKNDIIHLKIVALAPLGFCASRENKNKQRTTRQNQKKKKPAETSLARCLDTRRPARQEGREGGICRPLSHV